MRNQLKTLAAACVVVASSACGNLDYQKDPAYIACNEGAPLGRNERVDATAPKPAVIPGRHPDCQMGPDGLLRLRRQIAEK